MAKFIQIGTKTINIDQIIYADANYDGKGGIAIAFAFATSTRPHNDVPEYRPGVLCFHGAEAKALSAFMGTGVPNISPDQKTESVPGEPVSRGPISSGRVNLDIARRVSDQYAFSRAEQKNILADRIIRTVHQGFTDPEYSPPGTSLSNAVAKYMETFATPESDGDAPDVLRANVRLSADA